MNELKISLYLIKDLGHSGSSNIAKKLAVVATFAKAEPIIAKIFANISLTSSLFLFKYISLFKPLEIIFLSKYEKWYRTNHN